MLGLTYLFVDEPIEEDEVRVIAQFPHPGFSTWLQRTLQEFGVIWNFSASFNIRTGAQKSPITNPDGESYVADYNISCKVDNDIRLIMPCGGISHLNRYTLNTIDNHELNRRLRFWRWYDSSYYIVAYRAYPGKGDSIWLHMVLTSRPKDFTGEA